LSLPLANRASTAFTSTIAGRRVDGRVERTVHRDEIALADGLVEFDIVRVAASAGLPRVQHQEQMVTVAMNLGHLIVIRGVPNREWMKPERRAQRLLGLLIPHRYVNPDQPIGSGQQRGQLTDVPQLDSSAQTKRTSMSASSLAACGADDHSGVVLGQPERL